MKTSGNGYYLIRNIVDGMVYIGGTEKPIETRWSKHIYDLRTKRHSNKPLQEAWNKYGEFSFNFEVIENGFVDRKRETELILQYLPNCYNCDFPTMASDDDLNKLKFRKKITAGMTGKILRGEI